MSDRSRFGFNSYYTTQSLRSYHPSPNPSHSCVGSPASSRWTPTRSKIPLYSSLDSTRPTTSLSRPHSSRKSSESDVEDSRSNKINLLGNKMTYSVSKRTDSDSEDGRGSSLLSRFLPSPRGKYSVNRKSDSEEEKQSGILSALTARVPSPKSSIYNLLTNRGSYSLSKKGSESPVSPKREVPKSPGGYGLKKLRSVVSLKNQESSESVVDDSSSEEEESSEEESGDEEVYTIDRATSPKPIPTTQDPLAISATAVKPRCIRPNSSGRQVGVQTEGGEQNCRAQQLRDPETNNRPYESRYRPYRGSITATPSRYSPISILPRLDPKYSTYNPKFIPSVSTKDPFVIESEARVRNPSYKVGTKDFRKSPLNMTLEDSSSDSCRLGEPSPKKNNLTTDAFPISTPPVSAPPQYPSQTPERSIPSVSNRTSAHSPTPDKAWPHFSADSSRKNSTRYLSSASSSGHTTSQLEVHSKSLEEKRADSIGPLKVLLSEPDPSKPGVWTQFGSLETDSCYSSLQQHSDSNDSSVPKASKSNLSTSPNNLFSSPNNLSTSPNNVSKSRNNLSTSMSNCMCEPPNVPEKSLFRETSTLVPPPAEEPLHEGKEGGSNSSSSSPEEESKEETDSSSTTSSGSLASPVGLVNDDSSECSSDEAGTVSSGFKVMETISTGRGDMISESFTCLSSPRQTSRPGEASQDQHQQWWVRPSKFDSSQVPWWVNEDDSLEDSPENGSPVHQEVAPVAADITVSPDKNEIREDLTFHKGSTHKGWLEGFSGPSSPENVKAIQEESDVDFWGEITATTTPNPATKNTPKDSDAVTSEDLDFWWIKPTVPADTYTPSREGAPSMEVTHETKGLWSGSEMSSSVSQEQNPEPSWPDAGTADYPEEIPVPDESPSNALKKSPSQIPWWDEEIDYQSPNNAPPVIPEDSKAPPTADRSLEVSSECSQGSSMKLPRSRTRSENTRIDEEGFGCSVNISDLTNGKSDDNGSIPSPAIELEDATFQLFKDGDFSSYLDLESSVDEQAEEFEGFTDSYRNSLVIRTQLSVRVHTIIEKLLNSTGRELRRSLFVLKQIFQEDKDLIPEFVQNDGLACLIKIGTEADQTFQNYILRALGQLMLYVDGMNGVMEHNETVQWLYRLVSSAHRLVVKTAIKLLLVFVDYAESNCSLLVKATSEVHTKKGGKPWSLLMNILSDFDNADWEIFLYAMTLINKTLNGLPDQDIYYDQTDQLEELGIQKTIQRYMTRQGVDLDLLNQFHIYESVLKHEDGDNSDSLIFLDEKIRPLLKSRRSCGGSGANKRKSRRHSAEVNSINNEAVSPTYDPGVTMNGITPALRRRRERVERQKYLIREQEESQRNEAPVEPCGGAANGICDDQSHKTATVIDAMDLKSSSRPLPTPLDDSSNALENLQDSEADDSRDRVSLTGLVSKAKQELERSKSRQEIWPNESGVTPISSQSLKKTENDLQWDALTLSLDRPMVICDLDFSDLAGDELEATVASPAPDARTCPPPPPPPKWSCLVPPPPPTYLGPSPPPMPNTIKNSLPPVSPSHSTPQKNKKTIKLFWREVPGDESTTTTTVWDSAQQIRIDTNKLEHLFENRAKDIVKDKQQEHVKAKELTVLDHKRSNAINIAMTKLPPPRTIKTAILKMDASIMNREGIEKLLGLLPTEEEKHKIIEASVSNPDVPLGSAEQFLLTLGSINEVHARLMLWAFRLDFDILEKEVAEPLMDLKQGVEQLQQNHTFCVILFTLLTVGNFLNGSQSKGFYIDYLSKVPEVKDTVHKHSLLYHLCHLVLQNFPNTSDLYSEIGPLTRASKVDFLEIFNNLQKMEQDCKASWDHLKSIAKHDPNVKLKMKEFILDAAERIILLKQIHSKVINRFKKFLSWLGYSRSQIGDCDIQGVCKVISEFALEYRTARDRVQQQLIKKANHRQRNKTRGKLITDISGTNGVCSQVNVNKSKESEAELQLHKVLIGKPSDNRSDKPKRESFAGYKDLISGDSQGEILESLVKTATISSQHRPNRLRKRSKHIERKSMRRTLRNGLLDDDH